MKYTICPIVHGVQGFSIDKETPRNFSFLVRSFLPDVVRDYVIFPLIDWDEIVGNRQLSALEMEKGLPRQKLLRLKHTVGSDILWMFPKKGVNLNWIYTEIYDKFQREINAKVRIYKEDVNLCGIGHSWGGQLLLRYIFDSKYRFHGLFTIGAPITAVSGAFKDWGRLPPNLRFWVNFRMKYDWIGSQFKYHKSEQIRKFVEDVHISSWNPKTWLLLGAHVYYWQSKKVAKKIADTIMTNFYA